MRFRINFFWLEIPSRKWVLQLANKAQLENIWSVIRSFSIVNGIKYCGPGAMLKEIKGINEIVEEFQKWRNRIYAFGFSDVSDIQKYQPTVNWSLDVIMGDLFRCELKFESELDKLLDKLGTLVNEVVKVNQLLLSLPGWTSVWNPFSYIKLLPEVEYKRAWPPKDFRQFAIDNVVDIIYLKGNLQKEEQEVIHHLQHSPLIEGAERTVVDDMLVIIWCKDKKQDIGSVFAKKELWYVEHGDFPAAQGYNIFGDSEFDILYNCKPTKELTLYNESFLHGAKAVVFKDPEEIKNVIENLSRILASGKTAEGWSIEHITLITPSRESAIALHPLALQHGMNVVYAGDDNKLWDPFPKEKDANEKRG